MSPKIRVFYINDLLFLLYSVITVTFQEKSKETEPCVLTQQPEQELLIALIQSQGSGEALRASLMSQPFLCFVFLLLVETDPTCISHRVVLGICGCEFPV